MPYHATYSVKHAMNGPYGIIPATYTGVVAQSETPKHGSSRTKCEDPWQEWLQNNTIDDIAVLFSLALISAT